MQIKFLGALGQVTGSCSWLKYDKTGVQFLVDCGMVQGEIHSNYMNLRDFQFDPAKLKFVLLTHAHLDHCGLIPRLYEEGFKGNIICTKATGKLAKEVLKDSAKIGDKYDQSILKKMRFYYLDKNEEFEFGNKIEIDEGIKVYFLKNAHILGSTSIGVAWNDETGKEKSILFSGDLGNNTKENQYLPLLNHYQYPLPDTDYLVLESTYGGKVRDKEKKNFENRIEQLADIIDQVIIKKGKLIIPAFSIHRTQQILFDIHYILKYKRHIDYKSCINSDDLKQIAKNYFKDYSIKKNQYFKVYDKKVSLVEQKNREEFIEKGIQSESINSYFDKLVTKNICLTNEEKQLLNEAFLPPENNIMYFNNNLSKHKKERVYKLLKNFEYPIKKDLVKVQEKKIVIIKEKNREKLMEEGLIGRKEESVQKYYDKLFTNNECLNKEEKELFKDAFLLHNNNKMVLNKNLSEEKKEKIHEKLKNFKYPIKKDIFKVLKKLDKFSKFNNKAHIHLDSTLGLKATGIYGRELCRSKFNADGNRELFYRNNCMKEKLSAESDIQVDEIIKKLFPEHVSIKEKAIDYVDYKIYYKNKKIKKSPAIIISSNGMCNNGPILEHLKNYLKDEENIILLIGYQANNTNGYKLSNLKNMTKKQKEVDELSLDVYNTEYKKHNKKGEFIKEHIRYSDIKAQIIELKDYYSGHADQETLIDYVFNNNENRKTYSIFINHGEDESRLKLKDRIEKENQQNNNIVKNVYIPENKSGWYDLNTDRWVQNETNDNRVFLLEQLKAITNLSQSLLDDIIEYIS